MQPIIIIAFLAAFTLQQFSNANPAVHSSQANSRSKTLESALSGSSVDKCQCGQKQSQLSKYLRDIVGGSDAKPGEFPWYVYLLAIVDQGEEKPIKSVNCGGTIISPNWILTAAHCIAEVTNPDYMFVAYGETLRKMADVDKFIKHENYNEFSNDVALLHVKTPFEFGETVGPACLPWKLMQDFDGANVITTGLGATTTNSTVNTLQKVTLQVVGTQGCSEAYESLPDDVICAAAPGKGPCAGDSGGALEYFDSITERSYVIGVTNLFGATECAQDGYPSGYARVTSHLDWIQAMTGETFCKD